MRYFSSLYLNNRFFTSIGLIILIFILGYFVPWFMLVGKILLILLVILVDFGVLATFQGARRHYRQPGLRPAFFQWRPKSCRDLSGKQAYIQSIYTFN